MTGGERHGVQWEKWRRSGAMLMAGVWLAGDACFAQTTAETPPPIRDIAPPVDVFPYPAWQVAIAAGLALALVSLAVWWLVTFWRNRPAPSPPSPRESALAALREAERQLDALSPHAFSILVSDVLRRYVSAEFGLRATEQTSPEFLASVAGSARFSAEEKALLGAFLEKCDMIKFARVAASREESAALLAQAREFVEHAAFPSAADARAPQPAAGGAR